jgi:hypothetical protein
MIQATHRCLTPSSSAAYRRYFLQYQGIIQGAEASLRDFLVTYRCVESTHCLGCLSVILLGFLERRSHRVSFLCYPKLRPHQEEWDRGKGVRGLSRSSMLSPRCSVSVRMVAASRTPHWRRGRVSRAGEALAAAAVVRETQGLGVGSGQAWGPDEA